MLSFELSAVDLVLFVGIIILFILYLKFSPNFDWPKNGRRVESFKIVDERTEEKEFEIVDERTEEKYRVRDEEKRGMVVPPFSGRCPYNFGYLRKLSNDVSIPTECLQCSRILECRYEILSDSE